MIELFICYGLGLISGASICMIIAIFIEKMAKKTFYSSTGGILSNLTGSIKKPVVPELSPEMKEHLKSTKPSTDFFSSQAFKQAQEELNKKPKNNMWPVTDPNFKDPYNPSRRSE